MRAAILPLRIHRKPLSGISILSETISLINTSEKELINHFIFCHVFVYKMCICIYAQFVYIPTKKETVIFSGWGQSIWSRHLH